MKVIPNALHSRTLQLICKICNHTIYKTSGGLINFSTFYQPRYTTEEQKQILQILNESGPQELSRFDVSKNRIQSLQQFRRKRGKFCTLDQVLEVDGLGIKILEKLCDSILTQTTLTEEGEEGNSLKSRKQLKRNTSHFLIPNLHPIKKKEIVTAVGINIGAGAVTWSHMDIHGKLLAWDLRSLEYCSNRVHITSLLEVVQDICSNLPKGDIYVMEDRPTTMQSPQQAPAAISVNLQNAQMTAMLVALLNNQSTNSDGHRVFFLKSRLPARLFGALVGTERVSVQTMVLDILSGTQENSFLEEKIKPYSPITVTQDVTEKYLNRTSVEKESLCWALLLTMTFMDLVVLQNLHSLAVINGGR